MRPVSDCLEYGLALALTAKSLCVDILASISTIIEHISHPQIWPPLGGRYMGHNSCGRGNWHYFFWGGLFHYMAPFSTSQASIWVEFHLTKFAPKWIGAGKSRVLIHE
jgi:hypothetical protein